MTLEQQAEAQAAIIARRFHGDGRPGERGLIEQYADVDTMRRYKLVLYKSVKRAILKVVKHGERKRFGQQPRIRN